MSMDLLELTFHAGMGSQCHIHTHCVKYIMLANEPLGCVHAQVGQAM